MNQRIYKKKKKINRIYVYTQFIKTPRIKKRQLYSFISLGHVYVCMLFSFSNKANTFISAFTIRAG